MRLNTQSDPKFARIENELDETLQSFGYELVQLKAGGTGASVSLTVLIDKPDGVTAADCKYMAKRLSVFLEAEALVEEGYGLVVSSPGVNRPLTRDTDFTRFTGKKVAVRWAEPEGKPETVSGILRGLEDGNVHIEVNDEKRLIPLDGIESANVVYDWDNDPTPGNNDDN